MKHARHSLPAIHPELHAAIVQHLDKTSDASAPEIARAIGHGEAPGQVIDALNRLRTEKVVDCRKAGATWLYSLTGKRAESWRDAA